MSTELNFPGGEKKEPKTSGEGKSNAPTQKNVDISLPNTDRPTGPFDHSGETAGWTAEEEKEKDDEEKQQ